LYFVEKGKRKTVVVTKQGNKQACLEEFVENDFKRPVQAITYFQHIHTAHWQIAQFNQIKNQLPTFYKSWTLQRIEKSNIKMKSREHSIQLAKLQCTQSSHFTRQTLV